MLCHIISLSAIFFKVSEVKKNSGWFFYSLILKIKIHYGWIFRSCADFSCCKKYTILTKLSLKATIRVNSIGAGACTNLVWRLSISNVIYTQSKSKIIEIFEKRYIYSALHIPSQFYKFSKFSQKHLYKFLSKAISVG